MFRFGLTHTNKLFSSFANNAFPRLLWTKNHYWQMTEDTIENLNWVILYKQAGL
jgi:hypothetical protein